jgi:hypothetical protein
MKVDFSLAFGPLPSLSSQEDDLGLDGFNVTARIFYRWVFVAPNIQHRFREAVPPSVAMVSILTRGRESIPNTVAHPSPRDSHVDESVFKRHDVELGELSSSETGKFMRAPTACHGSER